MSLEIIAEPGSTHGGDYQKMVNLVDCAILAQANVIKFQWVSNAARLAARRNAPEYEEAYRLISFPAAWLERLANYCHTSGIEFMCTAYLPEDVRIVEPLVKRFKIASFEATDKAFLEAHNAFIYRPVILSTGMMTSNEVLKSFCVLSNVGAVLHCVSAYPTPVEEAHLDAIYQLRRIFAPLPVGFSDHTAQVTTGGLAVAAGAQILEVHYMAEGTPTSNPDRASALTVAKFIEYNNFARKVEKMMSYSPKGPRACEAPMMKFQVRA